jgi:hypothetical protein
MANTLDIDAQKQRKQKMILAVGGVILLALMAIQLPKIMGGSSTPKASGAASASRATGATGAEGVASSPTASSSADESAATPSAPVVPPGAPRAVLVGVTVGGAGRPVADEGQLRVFTLFDAKDPFVQQLPAETSGATSPTGEPTLSDTQPGAADEADAKPGASGGTAETAPDPAAPQFATVSVNGVVQPLEVDDTFPKKQPLFVLVGLKPKAAKIAIAGGSLTDGQTVTVGLGKNLTLVNTATGARYAIKLLYVGSEPERIAGFVKGEAKAK